MNNEITEEQFELAKSQVLFNFQNKMQNINTASKEVKNQLNRYGRFVSADDYAQILNEITIDELSNKIKEVFSNETYFVLVNSKDSKSDNLTKND